MDIGPTAIEATFYKSVVGRQQMTRDCDLMTHVVNHGDAPAEVRIVIGHEAFGCVQSFTLPPGGSRAPLDGDHPIPVYALQFRDIWIEADMPVTVVCALLEPEVRRIRGPIVVGRWVVERSEIRLAEP